MSGPTGGSPAGGQRAVGALTSFQQRRLDLADLLRAALPVAHAYGDEQREQEIRILLARLAAGRFQLAVVGQFSRGKTTLMNALLGGAYLPMGALPMTSVITTVRYGTRARALVRSRAAGLPIEVPVTDVARFIAQASAERTRMQVASVEVEIPAELLRLGFELVDTPGIGSAIAENTAATLHYLPRADAAVFVTGFDSALTEGETAFLTQAAGQTGKLFLVINKRDLVTETVAGEVTDYVQQWARQHLSGAAPQVFGLSALHALESVLQPDSQRLAGSGIEPFRTAVSRFLAAGQGKASLAAVATAAARLLARQERDMRAGHLAQDSSTERGTVTAEFDARIVDLQAEIAMAGDKVAGRVATVLPGRLAELRPAWQASLLHLIAPGAALDPAMAAGDALRAATSSLELAGRQVATSWVEQRAAEVQETLISITAGDVGSLLELARSPREQGAAVAGLPVFAALQAGWSADEIPELLIPQLEWAVPDPVVPRRLRHRHVIADEAALALRESLAAAVASFSQRAVQAFTTASGVWVRRLREDTERQASAEAAQFRRYLSEPLSDRDLEVVVELRSRLARFEESLTAWVPDSDVQPDGSIEPQAMHRTNGDRSCDICSQMESALTEYLIHRQFLLATSEDDQARHADAGGFCPLHTWQYAHMASAVGISAGNAKLAGAIGAALNAIGSSGGPAGQLAGAAWRLADPRECPACAVLARIEREAAATLASGAAATEGPVLCLHHLPMALEVSASPEMAKAMVATLASALERTAQDMRSYALKREALHRGLITADEAAANSRALRLLAGQPALVLPWERDPDGAAPAR